MQSFYLQQSICSIDTFTLVKHHPLYVSTGPVHNQSRQQDIIWTIDFSKNLNFWCLYFPDYCTTIHTLIDPEEHLTRHHVASWYEQPPQRLKKRTTSHHLVEPMKPRGWVEKCLQPYNCCLAERSVFNWRCCSWVKANTFYQTSWASVYRRGEVNLVSNCENKRSNKWRQKVTNSNQ